MYAATLPGMAGRAPTSIRLSAESRRILEYYAHRLGITQSAVMELALRQLAERGILVQPEAANARDRASDDQQSDRVGK